MAENLLLIELKSTESACKSNKRENEGGEKGSGIEDHVKGMLQYSRLPFFIQSRIYDAKNIIEQYKKLDLYPEAFNGDVSLNIDSISELKTTDVIRVVLLSNSIDKKDKDSALNYIIRNPELIEKYKEIDPDCQFWYTENNYDDPEIEVKDIKTYIKKMQDKTDIPKPTKKGISKSTKKL